jgi:acylphosphatase
MAQQYAITGWVRNLPDGRVELLVEGPEPEIDRFLKHLHEYWSRYILDEQIEAQSVTEQSAVFEVRR